MKPITPEEDIKNLMIMMESCLDDDFKIFGANDIDIWIEELKRVKENILK